MDARPQILAALRDRFPAWHEKLGDDHVLDLDVLKQIGGTALTDDVAIEMGERGLPNTFVPGRNILFLTAAAALGYRRGCNDLVGGMCETDYSGYPDCRDATTKSCAQTISLGMDQPFTIHTPLMFIDKAATWTMAQKLGGKTLVELIVEETVTCYLGNHTRRHPWGFGCGRCPACELRARGYQRYAAAP
jgi:7-cyano-7-deazaguanine synthase